MNVRVCVPWRPGDAGRTEGWHYVRAFWREAGFEPVTADSDPDKPFNRGQARNRAAEGDWDVAVFADACILPLVSNVHRAIDAAYRVRIVHAHSRVIRLTAGGTHRLITAARPTGKDVARTTGPRTPGGVFAIGRGLYDMVGGWDEGFEGWGGEDSAFVMRAGRFGSRLNIPGHAFHLWHAHSDRHIGSEAFKRNRARVRGVVWA